MIAFMTWLYRVTKNLPALGVSDPGVRLASYLTTPVFRLKPVA
jgi:hypothetical protein